MLLPPSTCGTCSSHPCLLLLGLSVILSLRPAPAQIHASFRVDVHNTIHEVDQRIYGHHLEHFDRVIQSGLWAELLRNRKFFPIDPDRTQVAVPWEPDPDRTHVSYVIDQSSAMVGRASQRVSLFGTSTEWRGIRQTGFDILAGKPYVAYAWIKATPANQPVSFRLEAADGTVAAHAELRLQPGDWKKYQVWLTPNRALRPAVFRIAFNRPGTKWIGAASLMPADNVDGLRQDVLELVRKVRPTVLRWPGGGYADCYDWRKAIGPRDLRPQQDILPFGQPYGYNNGMDDGDFGTDEFLQFCERLRAQPYITVNFGSGTPDMAAAWVEYCNGTSESVWGAKRAANGRRKPYKVRQWSIGNEVWGEPFQSGHTNARGYATYMVPIAKAMRRADPKITITAVGGRSLFIPQPGRQPDHNADAWNAVVLRRGWSQIDFLSLHHYFPVGFTPPPFTEGSVAFYRAVVAEPSILEQNLRRVLSQIDGIAAGPNRIDIALDEWNTWSWSYRRPSESPGRSAVNQFIDLLNRSGLEFNQTLRAAIFTARVLHVLMRLCDRVPIGIRTHLINSLGAIRTDSTRAFLTPPGLAMQLYSNHSGTTLLMSRSSAPTFTVPEFGWSGISYLDAVATRSENARSIFLHLINLHPDQPMETDFDIRGAGVRPQGELWQIAAESVDSVNDFDRITVSIRRDRIRGLSSNFSYRLPPHSITTIRLGLNDTARGAAGE